MKKFLGIVVLGLLLSGNAYAECIKGDCNNGYGVWIFSDGDKYSGNYKKGKMHGYGTYEYTNGDIAVGEFKKDKFKSVKYTWADGSYCTDYKNSCRGEYVEKDNSLNSNSTDIASLIDQAKDTCKSLGFKEGTEKFTDCSLKLYSQSLDLAAKQNQQVVIQNQGSSSGTVKMFDVVRDRENTMRKAKGLIDGSCTLANYVFC